MEAKLTSAVCSPVAGLNTEIAQVYADRVAIQNASANATTATTQANLSSDHRSDAGKYAVTAHNTPFTLSSTNGGTSGLYSAKHYATEAANSATAAANSASGVNVTTGLVIAMAIAL